MTEAAARAAKEGRLMLRKHILTDLPAGRARASDVKDIPALATVLVTSEAPDHPVDHLFDASDGPGGTRWIAAADGQQTLVLAFDAPQPVEDLGGARVALAGCAVLRADPGLRRGHSPRARQ